MRDTIEIKLNKHRREVKITCPDDCWCWDIDFLLSAIRKQDGEIDVILEKNLILDSAAGQLRSQLAEFVEIYNKIMDEKCPSDEKHCGCVPFLKAELLKRTGRDAKRGFGERAWAITEQA